MKLIAIPRMVAMYLCRRITKDSYPDIGRSFGKDHTTVMSGEMRIVELMEKNALLRDDVAVLMKRLGAEFRLEPTNIAMQLIDLQARVYKLEQSI